MNRTESTSPQHSYILEVGVIIGGGLSEPAFRHDCRIVTLGVVIVGTEEGGARRKNALQSSDSHKFSIGLLMTKRPARTLFSRHEPYLVAMHPRQRQISRIAPHRLGL